MAGDVGQPVPVASDLKASIVGQPTFLTEEVEAAKGGRPLSGQIGEEPRHSRPKTPAWRSHAMKSMEVTDPALLRGMDWSRLLMNNADALRDNTSDPKYFDASAAVDSLDTFLSHTWNTPRWKKFLVLVLYFNLVPAFVISFFVVTGACALTIWGVLPSVSFTDPLGNGVYTRGTLCVPIGTLTFILCLFGRHELTRLPLCGFCRQRRHTIFLDKTCVHQTDVELKKRGIESISAFIHRSESMLVMYSEAYMQRLWTCYEVASWMMLHPGEMMVARPLFAPIMVMVGLAIFFVLEPIWLGIGVLSSEDEPPQLLSLMVMVAAMFPGLFGMSFLAARWNAEREKLEAQVASFRLATASCACEEDRAVVQANIVAFMKYTELSEPEATDASVCERFEELVREKVPKLMWDSFGRVGVPYAWMLVFGFPHLLSTFDILAGDVLDHKSIRHIALQFIFVAVWTAGFSPLVAALIFKATRRRCLRNIPANLLLALLAVLLLAVSSEALEELTLRAEAGPEEDLWLGALLAACGLLIGTTYACFRPY